MELHRQALADAIEGRLAILGWSQSDLQRETVRHDPKGRGLSQRTVWSVASAEAKNPDNRTLATIDRALGWPLGTCAKVLTTGAGSPADEPGAYTEPELQLRVEELSAEVAALRDLVEDFIRPVLEAREKRRT